MTFSPRGIIIIVAASRGRFCLFQTLGFPRAGRPETYFSFKFSKKYRVF